MSTTAPAKPLPERIREREIMLAALKAAAPKLFNLKKPKPLALRFHKEVARILPEASEAKIRSFLGWWCRRNAYLRAIVKEGSYRSHLDGSRSGPVGESDRQSALAFIASRKERDRLAKETAHAEVTK